MRYWLALFSLAVLNQGVHAQQRIERIITLAPHATEIAYAAGLGNKIIAVSERSDFPKQALNKPKVANYKSINIERILSLHPDLVIAWPAGNPPRQLAKLKQMGVRIYRSKTRTLDDIVTNIKALSHYADDPSIGLNNALRFEKKIQQLRQKYQNVPKVSYFYQLSEKPIITIAQQSWPSEVFRLCGGKNIFRASASPYPQVGMEQVILARPQVIFNSRHAVRHTDMWQDWEQIPAIKHHHVWTLHSDWINRPTPRTLKAIEEVCHHFDQVRKRADS